MQSLQFFTLSFLYSGLFVFSEVVDSALDELSVYRNLPERLICTSLSAIEHCCSLAQGYAVGR